MPANNYQVRLLPIAEEDFAEIISFIAADNPTAATKLANNIENKLALLSENPEMGTKPRDYDVKKLGYRYIVVQNYLIFYTIEKKIIFIERILHGARDYKSLLWFRLLNLNYLWRDLSNYNLS